MTLKAILMAVIIGVFVAAALSLMIYAIVKNSDGLLYHQSNRKMTRRQLKKWEEELEQREKTLERRKEKLTEREQMFFKENEFTEETQEKTQ